METINFKTFREFKEWTEKQPEALKDRLMFRGQSDSSWNLNTTLERHNGKGISLLEYYRIVVLVKPQIEALTGRTWSIPGFWDYAVWLSNASGGIQFDPKFDLHNKFYKEFGTEVLLHLRHHGFPSPLLDWSRSPNIAAYFAYAHSSKTEEVAIYAYCEYPEGAKSGSSADPTISVLTPYEGVHRRHIIQQSVYTICTQIFPAKGGGKSVHSYVEHEGVFSKGDETQDKLWKILLPQSERLNVLKELGSYNLNAFSLFGTEESLCEALAFEHLGAPLKPFTFLGV